jgi:membrane-bound ClpP family serine protease
MFSGHIYHNADLFIRDAIEWRKQKKPKKNKLVFFLETGGGYIEVVQRIVNVLRTHYQRVEFYVPNAAMSAGTVLVMSGDEIYMDYYSILGPIDPQLPKPGGGSVPALGYLRKYEKFMEKADKGHLNTAEMTYLCTKFDPAELYQYEQARELSVFLLEKWLAKYKFRNWKKTKTRGKVVTAAMKKNRAHDIAEKLNDTDKWHTHGHGISMAVLRSREIKLLINDFGKNKELHQQIRDYWALLADHMKKIDAAGVIHAKGWYRMLSTSV